MEIDILLIHEKGGRSPRGERGLKCVEMQLRKDRAIRSLSSRRAWIEIQYELLAQILRWCRSPRGERGLKFKNLCIINRIISRSPRGERGLKLFFGS